MDNIILWIMAIAMVLGALDRMFGSRLGLGKQFEEGILAIGALSLSMLGILTLAPVLARLLRPVLRRLYPDFARDREVMDSISANVSANLLGLGNAATPLGIQAARRMARGCGGTASDELCLLVVLNTASIQLLPATIASVRSASGSETPFDILPAVWLASILSVTVGLLAAKLLSALGRCRR